MIQLEGRRELFAVLDLTDFGYLLYDGNMCQLVAGIFPSRNLGLGTVQRIRDIHFGPTHAK